MTLDPYELSYRELLTLARRVPDVVLIGGWAVWAYNPRLKSRDIDVLVPSASAWRLDEHLRGRGFVPTHGAHLRKRGYRLLAEDTSIDVDAYEEVIGPYRVAEVLGRVEERSLDRVTVRVLRPTELLTLKVAAAEDRRGSEKGMKDLSDLLALLEARRTDVDWEEVTARVPRSRARDLFRAALADYRSASRLYPIGMDAYRRLKRDLEGHGIL